MLISMQQLTKHLVENNNDKRGIMKKNISKLAIMIVMLGVSSGVHAVSTIEYLKKTHAILMEADRTSTFSSVDAKSVATVMFAIAAGVATTSLDSLMEFFYEVLQQN